MVSKEVKIFANPTGCAHGTGPTRPCRSQTAYHGHVAGRRRAGDARYALQLTIFPLPHRIYVDVDVDFYSLAETILRSVTGFKGKEGQNPSDSHTKKRHVFSESLSARSVPVPAYTYLARHRGTVANRLNCRYPTYALLDNPGNEVGKFLYERFCRASLDIHGSHLTSMAAS